MKKEVKVKDVKIVVPKNKETKDFVIDKIISVNGFDRNGNLITIFKDE